MNEKEYAYLQGGIDAWSAAAVLLETGTPLDAMEMLINQNIADLKKKINTALHMKNEKI